MIAWFKKAGKWIKRNFKWVLSIAGTLILFILLFSWYSKNKKIRKLQNELAILRAKVKLERLAVKYDVLEEDLVGLKAEDAAVSADLKKIEESLNTSLAPDMTAAEIVAKFKEIGLQ